jgi:hypothetical protein
VSYEAKREEMKQNKWRPAQLNGYPTSDGSGFGVIWEKDDGTPYRVRHDLTAEQYPAFLEAGRDEGFWPVSVSAYPHGGEMRFSAVLLENRAKRKWEARQDLTPAEVHEQNDRWTAQGYRPLVLSGYWQGTGSRYLAVWVEDEPS